MELNTEPVEAVASLMRMYSKTKYDLTGNSSHKNAFHNPTRSRWYNLFKKLYLELMGRSIDPQDYILWAMTHETTKHHAPTFLIQAWRYDAYVKSRKKAKASAVVDGIDYETMRGQAKSDMQVGVDRWQERGRFYANYKAFLRAEYPSLPALFLATDQSFLEVCQSSTGLMADKLNDVLGWVNYLWLHKQMAKEIGLIRDDTVRLAAAS